VSRAEEANRARELLDRGAYREAAEAFIRMDEMASAARALVCAKEYQRAAECYEMAYKPLDAARLYLQIRAWKKAAQLYSQAGDQTRADLALQQLRQEQGTQRVPSPPPPAPDAPSSQPEPAPPPEEEPWPKGEVWRAIKKGDYPHAAQIMGREGTPTGWVLLAEATHAKAILGLGEALVLARDYAVAGECFRRTGQILRAAQCMSQAGLNAEAAELFLRADEKLLGAQHLEKIHDWASAATVYRDCGMLLDAARCFEKDDEPVKAAALYLKAKEPDLALPLLQGVSPRHRNFGQCRLLAAKILFQKQQAELAVSMLAPLLAMDAATDTGLDAIYQAALLLEQSGESEKARDSYQRIQQAHFGYKDVNSRLEILSRAAAVAPPKAPPPAPPAAPPDVDLSPLRDCSLLNRLGQEDLRYLRAAGEVIAPQPGTVLVKAGEPDPALIIILQGGLAITPDPGNPRLAVGFLGPGDYVGLGSLLKSPPRPNALVAQGGTKILLLPPHRLEALASADPELGLRLFRSIAEHLVQTLAAQAPASSR
jgi:tetratricopeptide (TPR) repeat protein